MTAGYAFAQALAAATPGAQPSAQIAIDKARSAALYKRSTKLFQDRLEKGGVGLLVLSLKEASPVAGGLPIVDGKLVGIGTSGDTVDHDDQCAAAGIAALK